MIQWINNKFGTTYSELELDEIKNFTLLWNIYENVVFSASFSVSTLETEIIANSFNYADFEPCYNYFQDRYVEIGQINNRFSRLSFRQADRMSFVQDTLLGINQTSNNRILAIGIIVYRLRNNLFHGIKDYRTLDGQVENFRYANIYIRKFLEVYP